MTDILYGVTKSFELLIFNHFKPVFTALSHSEKFAHLLSQLVVAAQAGRTQAQTHRQADAVKLL